MSQLIDLVRSSLPATAQLILDAVEETTDGIVFRERAKHLPLLGHPHGVQPTPKAASKKLMDEK